MGTPTLRAPFPWFGGKSRAAHIIWAAFGDCANYVEPFAGSLAVLLARPTAPRIETVNDRDCYLANFWRAVQAAPDEVGRFADSPVNEADLHARHLWLVQQTDFRERMLTEPDFYDAKIAGWWVWGICQWIGSGWCSQPEWTGRANAGRRSRGINTAHHQQRPSLTQAGMGVHQERPRLAAGGRGVSRQIRDLSGDSGAAGRGIHASGLTRKLPLIAGGSKGVGSQNPIVEWMLALADRLRRVRVCCGDWTRVLGPAVTTCIGKTGVLLDPPYSSEAGRNPSLYTHDDLQVAHAVREWAIANGEDPQLRIALCGYEGEHDMPASWQCVPWKAKGGYGSQRKDGLNLNAARERIWLSPHCLPVEKAQTSLLDLLNRGAA